MPSLIKSLSFTDVEDKVSYIIQNKINTSIAGFILGKIMKPDGVEFAGEGVEAIEAVVSTIDRFYENLLVSLFIRH